MRTKTETLIKAMEILSNDIQSPDGIANAAILEASQRLAELHKAHVDIKKHLEATVGALHKQSVTWNIADRASKL